MAAASSGCWACSWAICAASCASCVSGRRRTSQVARRGVKARGGVWSRPAGDGVVAVAGMSTLGRGADAAPRGRPWPSSGITPLLALAKPSPGVTTTGVPAVEEREGGGREERAAAVRPTLTRGAGLRPEITHHGMLANPQRRGHGPPRPPLTVVGPDLRPARQPLRRPLVRELLGVPWRRWGGTGTARVPSGSVTGAWRRVSWTASRNGPGA